MTEEKKVYLEAKKVHEEKLGIRDDISDRLKTVRKELEDKKGELRSKISAGEVQGNEKLSQEISSLETEKEALVIGYESAAIKSNNAGRRVKESYYHLAIDNGWAAWEKTYRAEIDDAVRNMLELKKKKLINKNLPQVEENRLKGAAISVEQIAAAIVYRMDQFGRVFDE